MSNNIISIKGLCVTYKTRSAEHFALRDIDLEIKKGSTVAIVGESGCGKSTLALSLLKLLPDTAKIKGTVNVCGSDITQSDTETLRRLRGASAGMIFQDPGASLNPLFRIRQHFEWAIRAHEPSAVDESIKKRAVDLLLETGITDTQRVYQSYPHQLSGGMQQRVMIALALVSDPEILIADEPTTALDVTVQAQIIELLKKLQQKRGLTLIFITHDLHMAVTVCERLIVMYSGEIVEDIVPKKSPAAAHHYTAALFRVIPDIAREKKEFMVIPGELPKITHDFNMCSFYERCPAAQNVCAQSRPELKEGKNGAVRCFFPLGDKA